MSELTLCRHLPWDSEFFGFPIARVDVATLDADAAAQALAWCRRERIRCLYYLCSPDPADAHVAEISGFRLIDIRLTLDWKLTAGAGTQNNDGPIRPFVPSDADALRAIARTSFTDARFLADPGFPHGRAVALYDTWLSQSWEGDAQAVLVGQHDGAPAGFVTCHLDPGPTGRIGLLGVSEAVQGSGVGRMLVDGALEFFTRAGASTVSVVTQGRNIRAQRLYQRCGFRTVSVSLWYHRWFTGA